MNEDPIYSLYLSSDEAVCSEGELGSYSDFRGLSAEELASIIEEKPADYAAELEGHEYEGEFLFWYQPQGRAKSILRVIASDDGVSIDETYEESSLAEGGSKHANLAVRNPDQKANLYCQ